MSIFRAKHLYPSAKRPLPGIGLVDDQVINSRTYINEPKKSDADPYGITYRRPKWVEEWLGEEVPATTPPAADVPPRNAAVFGGAIFGAVVSGLLGYSASRFAEVPEDKAQRVGWYFTGLSLISSIISSSIAKSLSSAGE
jgi:hypothetical protein